MIHTPRSDKDFFRIDIHILADLSFRVLTACHNCLRLACERREELSCEVMTKKRFRIREHHCVMNSDDTFLRMCHIFEIVGDVHKVVTRRQFSEPERSSNPVATVVVAQVYMARLESCAESRGLYSTDVLRVKFNFKRDFRPHSVKSAYQFEICAPDAVDMAGHKIGNGRICIDQ